jgi:hypothetical protein
MIPTNEGRVSRRRCWFHASSVTKYVIVRSRVGWFEGHWRGGRSFRCPGKNAGCSTCESGKEPEIFWYLFVETDSGEVLVWNPPRRLEDLLREIDSSENGGVGLQLAIRREGIRQNSRIEAEIVGVCECEDLDVEPFVSTLGIRSEDTALEPALPKVLSDAKS